MIVAHRGASRDASENTLEAFNLAWAQGADAIEGDFHLTKDKRIICHHDPDIGNQLVKDLFLGELHEKAPNIPTLEEVLATVPEGKSVFLEIKCGEEIVPYLLESIDHSGLPHDSITIISFHPEVIRSVKTDMTELNANWLVKYDLTFPFRLCPSFAQTLEFLESIGADGLGTHPRYITRKMVTELNKAGYSHHVWTVDHPWLAKLMLSWGTESITTNVPQKMIKSLKRG